MLGAIIGNMVGAGVENRQNKTVGERFTLFRERTHFSTDTVMMCAVAYWILTDMSLSYERLEEAMLGFYKKCPAPRGSYGKDLKTWFDHPDKVFVHETDGKDDIYKSKSGRRPYGSKGDGAASRAIAIG